MKALYLTIHNTVIISFLFSSGSFCSGFVEKYDFSDGMSKNTFNNVNIVAFIAEAANSCNGPRVNFF